MKTYVFGESGNIYIMTILARLNGVTQFLSTRSLCVYQHISAARFARSVGTQQQMLMLVLFVDPS